MPLEARWLIKTALLYLVLALGLGIALAGPLSQGPDAALYPTYLHLLTVGWLTQLIFGVAYWLFPRASQGQFFEHRGVVWAAYGCLNAGLLLRALTEPFLDRSWIGDWGMVGSAFLLWLGGMLFVAHLWPRVRTK